MKIARNFPYASKERERETRSERERERAWVSSFSHVVCNVVAQLLCRKSGQRAERIGMWMSSGCRGRGKEHCREKGRGNCLQNYEINCLLRQQHDTRILREAHADWENGRAEKERQIQKEIESQRESEG